MVSLSQTAEAAAWKLLEPGRWEGKRERRVRLGGGAQGHAGSGLIPAEWGAGCQAGRSPEAAEAVPERTGKNGVRSGDVEKRDVKQFGVRRPSPRGGYDPNGKSRLCS